MIEVLNMPKSLNRFVFTIISAALLSGCATVNTGYRIADTLATGHNFTKEYIKTGLCDVTSFYHLRNLGGPLTVYIEGDGFAWRSRHELSDDPTPRHPLVLSLAAIDPSDNVAYLARPGQLTASGKPDCDPAYWSEKRFSQEVVSAINSGLDYLKAKSQAKEINIIGYSGGAFIALLVTAERGDVSSLRTIAGNLDPEAVNRYHKVSPLEAIPNPIDIASKISHIPQRHFVSASDSVISVSITGSFAEKVGDQRHESITIVEGTNHTAGWQKAWPSLIQIPLYNRNRFH